MTTRGDGSPLRRASASGCSSGTNGEPSSLTASAPRRSSADPRIRWALGFQPEMTPAALLKSTPSWRPAVAVRERSLLPRLGEIAGRRVPVLSAVVQNCLPARPWSPWTGYHSTHLVAMLAQNTGRQDGLELDRCHKKRLLGQSA